MADGPWGAAASNSGAVGPWAATGDSGAGITGSIGGKPKKGSSITGFLSNAVDSTWNAAGSVIPGIEQTATALAHDAFPRGWKSFNPLDKESYKEGMDNPFSEKTWKDELEKLKTGEVAEKIVKPGIESYKQRYSGGLGEILHNFYEDPVPFVLDAATVFGVGVNTAAKVGSGLEGIGAISSGSKLAQLSKPGEIQLFVKEGLPVTKFTSARPTTKMAQQAWDKTLKMAPADMKVIGEYARAGKLLGKSTNITAIRHQLAAGDYLDSFSKLSKNERTALAIMQEAPTAQILEGWKKAIRESGEDVTNLKLLEDPKVMALWQNPSDDMLRTHQFAGELGNTNVALLKSKGQQMSGAETRPYLTSLLASGAKFVPDPEIMAKMGFDVPVPNQGLKVGKLTVGDFVFAHDRKNYGRLIAVNDKKATVHFVNKREGIEATVDLPVNVLGPASAEMALQSIPKKLVGPDGGDIAPLLAQVKQHIAESGRPIPVYRPHQSVAEKSGRGWGGSGGRGIPVAPRGTRQNTGVLAQMGRLALDPDLLGPAYMRSVKYALYSDRHDVLLSHAVPRDHLPDGFLFVRKKRNERMLYTDKTQDQFIQDLKGSLPDNKPPQDMDLVTTHLADAATDATGKYLVVPKSFADNVVGEFGKTYTIPARFVRDTMTVWRAMVLGLRPAWLVNNIIGNHLLAAIRFAGIDGLRAYLNAIYNTKGAATVRKMLKMEDMPVGLSQQFMREFFPEQVHGTFIGSQMPTGKSGKWGKRASLGLAPLDRASEGMLRRASVETALRRSPELRAQANKMLGETRTFEDMARDAITMNKGVAERASAEVNAAMGDFLTLGELEKNFIRQIVPFYAWFKAITKVTLRMPVDMPIRTNLLANLSAIAADNTEAEFGSPLPNYLKSGISLGENRLLRTGGMSPWSTVAQLASAGRSAFPGGSSQNTRDLLGLFNPFLAEAQTVFDPYQAPKFGTLAQIPFDVLRNTPQARILFPRESQLYEDDARMRALRAYFGVPTADINRAKAAKDAADGK